LAGIFAERHPDGRAQTIVQAASLFNQLLQHFPRTEFAALVKKHNAERAAKGFTCWTQFVAMLFCQLGRADSLRDICNGLACCLGRLVHRGIAKAPSRSTLSYANEHRPAGLFEELFWTALARFREQQGLGSRKHKFRFKNKLLSLDSTTISVCLTLFPWAQFRRAKGGVKAHVLLDHDDYLPAYVLLTEAKRSDVKLADSFTLNPGSIVTMDRGYTDYALFGRWTLADVFFVTRMKDNADFSVESEFEVPARNTSRRMTINDETRRCLVPPVSPRRTRPAAPASGSTDALEHLTTTDICVAPALTGHGSRCGVQGPHPGRGQIGSLPLCTRPGSLGRIALRRSGGSFFWLHSGKELADRATPDAHPTVRGSGCVHGSRLR